MARQRIASQAEGKERIYRATPGEYLLPTLMITKKFILAAVAVACGISGLRAELITVLTSGNRLLTIDSATPGTVTKTVLVTGLGTGESLLGIDARPSTGALFGLGSTSRLYAINTGTGVATAIGSAGVFTLNGTSFGFDFNPTVDRIRLTSNTGQNLRVNPNDGTLSGTDTALAYAGTDVNNGQIPSIVGSAYTNSFATATATVLYDIDSALDTLVIQNPPNNGTLNTVGNLGVDASNAVGFDISGTTGASFAALNVGGVTGLYTINLLSGAGTLVGAIAPTDLGSETVVDIAANVNPGSRLANLSSRGRVAPGQEVLIAGFISTGGLNSRVVLRAIGPSLSTAGITGALADPVITLYDRNGTMLATNDNWKSNQEADITATGLAPTNDNEAVILTRLAPDAYTAIVSGKANATGLALVEVYQLP